MAYVIGDACVNCGTCADACPLGIISEGDGKYVIDADQCVECGTCAAECPNDAIRNNCNKQSARAQHGRFVCHPERAELFPDGDFTLTADGETLRGLGRLRFWGCAFPLGIV